jgi:hypothetical protein
MSDTTIISVQRLDTAISYDIEPDQWRVTVSVRRRSGLRVRRGVQSETKHTDRERAVHLAESMANLLDLLGQPFELRVAGELARIGTSL